MHLLREKTAEMRNLQKKVKKLEKCREKVVEVGRDTDSDFRVMFNPIQTGLFWSICDWGGGGGSSDPPSVSLEPIMVGS